MCDRWTRCQAIKRYSTTLGSRAKNRTTPALFSTTGSLRPIRSDRNWAKRAENKTDRHHSRSRRRFRDIRLVLGRIMSKSGPHISHIYNKIMYQLYVYSRVLIWPIRRFNITSIRRSVPRDLGDDVCGGRGRLLSAVKIRQTKKTKSISLTFHFISNLYLIYLTYPGSESDNFYKLCGPF